MLILLMFVFGIHQKLFQFPSSGVNLICFTLSFVATSRWALVDTVGHASSLAFLSVFCGATPILWSLVNSSRPLQICSVAGLGLNSEVNLHRQ
jgi:hypothetical protein